jgi:hypothetical protein
MANTSLPCSTAWRAVIREPDCSAASTTSVPAAQARNDAVALRKIGCERRCSQRVFADDHALACNGMGERQVPLGVHAVQSCTDHGNGRQLARCRSFQGATMRGAIHAQCHARHHCQPGAGQSLGKLLCVGLSLGRGVAAAHDGHAAGKRIRCQFLPHHVQHERRVIGGQQGGGVSRVAERDDAPPAGFVHALQPGPGGLHQGVKPSGSTVRSAAFCGLTTCSRACKVWEKMAWGRPNAASRRRALSLPTPSDRVSRSQAASSSRSTAQ